MNLLDIAVLLVVVLSCVFGLWRGFVREVLSLLVWIAAIVVARLYSPHLAPMFNSLTDNETGRYVLAFAILCFATLLLGALINHFMARLISLAGLQLTDRLLGAVFGIARGVLIVAVAVYFAAEFYSDRIWWVESQTLPYVQPVIDWGSGFFVEPETEI
ncbi:MAG: CvpA family protein [Pseudohongiella sp.]|uniref:CvpA family protein n=1 Tax=Pseudohongiella sp. TaxID=1979412 RepID=UPI0034A0A0A0